MVGSLALSGLNQARRGKGTSSTTAGIPCARNRETTCEVGDKRRGNSTCQQMHESASRKVVF